MTTQELSAAAARDEVAYLRTAIERTDRKLERLRGQVEETEGARARFVNQLEWAEDEAAMAQNRDVDVAAGAAEGQGDA